LLRRDGHLLPGAATPAGDVFADVACAVGRNLDARAEQDWLWKGRRVYLFDGTTVTMPDSRENQKAYPQVYNQKPGLGFPIARNGAVISLPCGAVVNLGFCQYAGKGQGEVGLLCRLWDVLRPGDVLLGDRLLGNWATIAFLGERGVELVSRLNTFHRRVDFRRGQRLGPDDHVVQWRKPTSIRSLDREAYHALPESITVRETRIWVRQPGFRTREIVVVTTLLDPQQAILRHDVAETEKQILVVIGQDAGNAPRIALDLHAAAHTCSPAACHGRHARGGLLSPPGIELFAGYTGRRTQRCNRFTAAQSPQDVFGRKVHEDFPSGGWPFV
jgi:hypothetical protein